LDEKSRDIKSNCATKGEKTEKHCRRRSIISIAKKVNRTASVPALGEAAKNKQEIWGTKRKPAQKPREREVSLVEREIST